MKAILITSACTLIHLSVISQSQGPFAPGSFSTVGIPGSSSTWINLNNAAGSDDQYSSFNDLPDNVGDYTDFLLAKGFNFNIPLATIIKGVVVEVEVSDPNKLTADYSVMLNLPNSEDKSNKIAYNNVDEITTYGSNSDLWGETLDHGKINDPEFGVKIAVQRDANGGATLGQIDDIRITVYYAFIILPVKLISFSAVKDQNIVNLNWSTTDESGMDHFEIERSTDGRVFSAIINIPCRNQVFLNNYSGVDNFPYTGVSYYRLKMVGVSGDIKYSNIVSINNSGDHEITIYPNPLRKGQKLFINNPAKEEFRIQFFNITGKLLTTVTTSSGEIPVLLDEQPKSTLVYRVNNRNNETVASGRILFE